MHFFFLGAYIFILAFIGFLSFKKVKGMSDFLLGRRSINPWMSAFSYGTAYFSAVIFIGYGGKIGWTYGMPSLWIVAGNAFVGTFLAWHILGKRTREMTTHLKASTMPEFIGLRYESRALKIASAVIIFVFLIPYSASVYKGLSYMFEETLGLSNITALLIMTVLTALYLFFGGFVAATLSDFIQGIIMIVGVFAMLYFVTQSPAVGGIAGGLNRLQSISPELTSVFPSSGKLNLLSLVILTSLGSWGLPQMVHKFYTIKSDKAIFCAKWVSTGFSLIIAFGAYFIGGLSRIFFPDGMPSVNGIPDPDQIVPRILNQTLPEWAMGIILILILSASMSTLASLVLASSSAIAVDLVKGSWLRQLPDKKVMLLMRVLCVVFVVLSFIMAVLPNPIVSLAALSWGAVSGSLLAPYLYGLFSKKVTKAGVWSGMLTALGIVLIGASVYGINSPMVPIIGGAAIVLPLLIVPAVSMVTKDCREEHLQYIYQFETRADS
jgi:SSS family solute:Na+ symporter